MITDVLYKPPAQRLFEHVPGVIRDGGEGGREWRMILGEKTRDKPKERLRRRLVLYV